MFQRGDQGSRDLRSSPETRNVWRRQLSSNRRAEFFLEINGILRVEDTLGSEEFFGATGIFRAQHGNSGEQRFAGNQPPRILKSWEDQDIRGAIYAQHRLRGLRRMKFGVFEAKFFGQIFGSRFIAPISNQ